jgi:hypothetical protein
MPTTAGGLPYPASTDFVKDGALAIQNLAEGIESRGGGYYTIRGTSTWTIPSSGQYTFVYPWKFTAQPVCKFIPQGKDASYNAIIAMNTGNPFTYQASFSVYSIHRTTFAIANYGGALTVNWEITGPGPLTPWP